MWFAVGCVLWVVVVSLLLYQGQWDAMAIFLSGVTVGWFLFEE